MTTEPQPSHPPKLLTEATAQEIQLELIRRLQFNFFDGKRVYDSLIRHRELWVAVMMDSLYGSGMDRMAGAGLLKLRDLPQNFWHVDTLYILTPDANSARRFAAIIEDEGWGEEISIYDQEDEVQDALGGSESGYGIVSVWWD